MSKQAQRQAGLVARRALSCEARREKSAAVCARIEACPAFLSAKTVLSYRALPDEVDLGGLDAAGKTVAYPRCGDKGQMRAFVPHDGAFTRGAFGIEEPDPAHATELAAEDIDLVLVPCSAFDTAGGRVGMGGGYYDRYLPGCVNAVRLLIAFETQRVEEAAMDAHDLKMDMAATEAAFYDFKRE